MCERDEEAIPVAARRQRPLIIGRLRLRKTGRCCAAFFEPIVAPPRTEKITTHKTTKYIRSLRFSIFSGFELSGARARGRVSEERRTEKHAQATTREVRERKAPLPVVGAFIWGFHTRAGRCTGWVLRVVSSQNHGPLRPSQALGLLVGGGGWSSQ